MALSFSSCKRAGNAAETPFGIDEGLNEAFLLATEGTVLTGHVGGEALIGGEIVGGQEDGLAGETGFERVVRGDVFAFGCFRPG